jgi:peptidoglycan/LPS O-acetylase OafA/YrhL
MYKFVMSALATLVTAYLLVLILTVAITWCINRLMVRPLRKIARELNDVRRRTGWASADAAASAP